MGYALDNLSKSSIQILRRAKQFCNSHVRTTWKHTGKKKFCSFKSSCTPPSSIDLLVVNPQLLKFIPYLYPQHLANELDLKLDHLYTSLSTCQEYLPKPHWLGIERKDMKALLHSSFTPNLSEVASQKTEIILMPFFFFKSYNNRNDNHALSPQGRSKYWYLFNKLIPAYFTA